MIFIKVFQMQNTLIKMTMELQKIRLARRVKNFMHSFQNPKWKDFINNIIQRLL